LLVVTPGDRRFVNNPFARRLHPEESRSWGARLALVLVSIFGAVVMAVAFVLPMVFAPGLLVGGVRAHRWGMVAAGAVVIALYALLLVGVVRRLLARRRSA
jgi:hypothetical protein